MNSSSTATQSTPTEASATDSVSKAAPSWTLSIQPIYLRIQQLIQYCVKNQTIDKATAAANKIADFLTHAYLHEPSALVAQCSMYQPQFGYIGNLLMSRGVFATMLCHDQHWNALTTRSVVSAALLTQCRSWGDFQKYAENQELSDKNKRKIQQGCRLSQRSLKDSGCQDPLLLDALGALEANRAISTKINRQARAVVELSIRFSRLVTPNQRVKVQHPTHVVKHLLLTFTQSNMQSLLNIAALRFAPLHFGSIVKFIYQKPESSPEVRLGILMAPIEHEYNLSTFERDEEEDEFDANPIVPLREEAKAPQWLNTAFEPANAWIGYGFREYQLSGEGDFCVVHPQQVLQQVRPKVCREPAIFAQLWEHPLQTFRANYTHIDTHIERPDTEKLFKPQEILVALLKELRQESPNVTELGQLVDQSEYLKALLTQFASKQTKQQLEIKDSKHALMMIGLERLAPLVVQSAIDERLCDFQFPGFINIQSIKHALLHIVRLTAEFNTMTHPEDAALLAHLFVTPYFLNTSIQLQAFQTHTWFATSQTTYDVDEHSIFSALFLAAIDDTHKTRAQQLAKRWFAPKDHAPIFNLLEGQAPNRELTKKQQLTTASIHLGLHICLAICRGISEETLHKNTHFLRQLKLLKISPKSWEKLWQESLDISELHAFLD